MKPSLIIHRKNPYPHMEVHYTDHVEFIDYENRKRGSSPVWEVKT